MSISMIFRDKKFAPLMWTQFFGALNDNVLKNALVVLVAFRGVELLGFKSESLVSAATLIFIFPFFVFSTIAGQIADKFDKSKVIQTVKFAEILIMLLAGYGFAFSHYSALFLALFLMGIHSAFFGPVKYSALPELIAPERLVAANALVEVGTFIAILVGTMAGGYLVSLPEGKWLVVALLVGVSGVGYFLSRSIPRLKVADPHLQLSWNPVLPTWRILQESFKNKAVSNSILGISWFWLLGAVVLSVLPTLTTHILNGNEHLVTLFLAVFSVGVAAGAVLCEKISFDRVEIGLVPFGSLGFSFFLFDFAWVNAGWVSSALQLDVETFFAHAGAWRFVLDLFGIAVSGGIFTVPLYTLIQQRSNPESRSRIIGANNVVNSIFMVIGSALLILFYQLDFSLPVILCVFSTLNLLVTFLIYSSFPEFTLRFCVWILAHIMYRVKANGLTHIPKTGPAVLVCNHVSYVDWLIVGAMIKRPVRFVMYYKFAKIPGMKYLSKSGGVILIAGSNEDGQILQNAFEQIAAALNRGEIICLFPEGGLTRDGELQKFKRGVEKILDRNPVPVVPMALSGLWGSMFSRRRGKVVSRLQRKFWYRVELRVGGVIPYSQAQVEFIQSKVRELLA